MITTTKRAKAARILDGFVIGARGNASSTCAVGADSEPLDRPLGADTRHGNSPAAPGSRRWVARQTDRDLAPHPMIDESTINA